MWTRTACAIMPLQTEGGRAAARALERNHSLFWSHIKNVSPNSSGEAGGLLLTHFTMVDAITLVCPGFSGYL